MRERIRILPNKYEINKGFLLKEGKYQWLLTNTSFKKVDTAFSQVPSRKIEELIEAQPYRAIRVLDVCSGGYTQTISGITRKFGKKVHVTGIDIVADTRHPQNHVLGDARKLPIADDSIDVGFSFQALKYLPEEERPGAVAEVARVLRPGGVAVLDVFVVIHNPTPPLDQLPKNFASTHSVTLEVLEPGPLPNNIVPGPYLYMVKNRTLTGGGSISQTKAGSTVQFLPDKIL